jgi:superoxide dismutase, Cu-Zn family
VGLTEVDVTKKNKVKMMAALALGGGALALTSAAFAAAGQAGPAMNAGPAGTEPTGSKAVSIVSDPTARAERSGTAGYRHAHAVLRDVDGNRVGVIDITALGHGHNQVSVRAWSLTPGFHGFHVHAVGICDPAGAKPFASAGGHFNPAGTAEGMQAGAFPVILAGADGRAQAEFVDSNFTINELAGPSGAAIVVHAAADNYANIPVRYTVNGTTGPDAESQMTGDGGARVACAVVFPTHGAATPSTTPTANPTAIGTAAMAPRESEPPNMSSNSGMNSMPTMTTTP